MGMEQYKMQMHPVCRKEALLQGDKYRISVLTPALLRLEYHEDGKFEDRATQSVLNRDFPVPDFRVLDTESEVVIYTDALELHYDRKAFTPQGLMVKVYGGRGRTWHFGEEPQDLGGTARTLDMADGAYVYNNTLCTKGPNPIDEKIAGKVPIEHGVISREGFSVIDDSHSMVLTEDGWIAPRAAGVMDYYFFGYGTRYLDCLKDFYYLCGKTPLLPRYALGNWWSRYHRYTQTEYQALIERFEAENLPFSVAVVDMDWHLVDDVDPKYGSGWTGYTWNTAFFPDPAGFMKWLHAHGMKITLNVHPADGVRAFEKPYRDIAQKMGIDPDSGDAVTFDPADPHFMEVYLKDLHHPLEEEGVDFWWLDWQQGTVTKVPGLDPLWMLNHYHYLDSAWKGSRPITFSRYAGVGSHRYPVGFSGDTVISWDSLRFQPYFTNTASNIGYGWWSHDIGGHMQGYKEDELTARWTQFGIYSPVMRLHSTKSEFNGKEPWRFKGETREVMGEALRERHRMIPYLYSMNYRNYQEDLPVICPMYYEYPEEQGAYEAANQYYFGSELTVAPVTSPRISRLNVAPAAVWLPEGLWYDIYTGMIYEGGRNLVMYRTLKSIPVLAKAGGILPFTREISALQAVKNPDSLWIRVYGGADGSFVLYEDDNETCGYEKGIGVKTRMTYQEGEQAVFTVEPAEGDCSLIPAKRDYLVELTGFASMKDSQVQVKADGRLLPKEQAAVGYEKEKQAVTVCLKEVNTAERLEISLDRGMRVKGNLVRERIFDFLNQAEIEFRWKDELYRLICSGKSVPVLLGQMNAMGPDKDLYGVFTEFLTAWQVEG